MKKNPSLSILTFIAFSALTAIASGCGQSAYNENDAAAVAPGASTGSNPYYPTTPGSTGTGSTTTTTNNPALGDPTRATFRIAGTTTPPSGSYAPAATSQTVTNIRTDNKLSVTVTGGDPIAVAGTGYTASFSCLRVDVTVAGQTQSAYVTNTGAAGYGYCQGAVASQTLDFSNVLSPGHGLMSVKVSNPMYDNCRLYGAVYTYGCPVTAVYWNHQVQGKLEIHTNGTN